MTPAKTNASRRFILDKSDPLLSVQNMHTYYGDSYVLQGIDVAVPRGQIVAVLGRNGMGKTTLIRSICGLTPAREGEVRFMDQAITSLPAYRIAQMGLSLVPQGRRIFRNLSVRENLMLPISGLAGSKRRSTPGSGHTWTLEGVLDEFPQLRERLSHGGHELSGGEQQMLTIGRALMTNPDVLILDEATEGLAPLIAREIWRICEVIRDSGISSIIVDKNWKHVTQISNRNVILVKGEVVFDGDTPSLLADPELLQKHLGV